MSVIHDIRWPEYPTVENLAPVVGAMGGFTRVVLGSFPEEHRHRSVSGMTVPVEHTAYVYYDPELPSINKTQTILHEYAHIIHGEACPDGEATHYRTSFDDPREQRAERTGMHLMLELNRRQSRSDVVDFLAGKPQ